MVETRELKFHHLCQVHESNSNHFADQVTFDKDVKITAWDGMISSFPDLHAESWLWVNGSSAVEPFAHVACDWELWSFRRFKLLWKIIQFFFNKRLGNNSGVIPNGLLIKKGEELKLGCWWDNMRDEPRDFHAKTSVYVEEQGLKL